MTVTTDIKHYPPSSASLPQWSPILPNSWQQIVRTRRNLQPLLPHQDPSCSEPITIHFRFSKLISPHRLSSSSGRNTINYFYPGPSSQINFECCAEYFLLSLVSPWFVHVLPVRSVSNPRPEQVFYFFYCFVVLYALPGKVIFHVPSVVGEKESNTHTPGNGFGGRNIARGHQRSSFFAASCFCWELIFLQRLTQLNEAFKSTAQRRSLNCAESSWAARTEGIHVRIPPSCTVGDSFFWRV